ncbi:MAG: hypothetical protein ACK4TA_26495 [Saprospiraceae bacterium]
MIHKLRQQLKWNFYPERQGTELRLFRDQVNKNQRIYLHITDKYNNVVTASYPIEP